MKIKKILDTTALILSFLVVVGFVLYVIGRVLYHIYCMPNGGKYLFWQGLFVCSISYFVYRLVKYLTK